MRSLWFLYRISVLISALLIVAALAWPRQVEAASLNLTWTDNSGNEDGFNIERKSGSSFTKNATTVANVTSYTESGLTAGTTYCYQVRSFSSAGTSAPPTRVALMPEILLPAQSPPMELATALLQPRLMGVVPILPQHRKLGVSGPIIG